MGARLDLPDMVDLFLGWMAFDRFAKSDSGHAE
jgi:hypothetical protein